MLGDARRRKASALACGILVVLAAGCTAPLAGSGTTTTPSPRPATTTSAGASSLPSTKAATPTPAHHTPRTPPRTPPRTAQAAARTSKVLVVIEENHSLDQMRSGMPYLAAQSDRYGYATHWTALTHPSEPNYLAIAGGSTFGVRDDSPPATNAAEVGAPPSVFDQALRHGRTAATYAESMPRPCDTHSYPSGAAHAYAVRHNPWAYFSSGRADCLAHDHDLTAFAPTARADELADVTFLIPDLTHDAHDGTLSRADAWLRQELGPVLASADFTSGRLAVVVTADEDDKHSGNRVLTSVLSAHLQHKVVDVPLDHYSLTRFIDDVIGQPPLGHAKEAGDLRAAFGL